MDPSLNPEIPKLKLKPTLKILMFVVGFLLIFITGFIRQTSAPDEFEPKTVLIEPGLSASQISDHLEKENIVRSGSLLISFY